MWHHFSLTLSVENLEGEGLKIPSRRRDVVPDGRSTNFTLRDEQGGWGLLGWSSLGNTIGHSNAKLRGLKQHQLIIFRFLVDCVVLLLVSLM